MRTGLTRLPLPGLLVASLACGEATGPTAARRGETFTLGVGETALLEAEGLLVGFTAVTGDSRCPTDVVCIVAGDAAVELWVRRPPADREIRVLHTDPDRGRSAEYDGFVIELVGLQPLPRSDQPVAPDAYRAHIAVR